MTIRTYRELIRLETFLERYHYLRLYGSVGHPTFGSERYINQQFYTSTTWRNLRNHVITRDLGRDLAAKDHEIYGRAIIHHMNPMTPEDIIHGEESIMDPEFLITVAHKTHNAIHYGDERLLPRPFVERTPGDTKLW